MGNRIRNIVVVSDTHFGCQLGLCPPKVLLDSGGSYCHSKLQQVVWGWWNEFWGDWVPTVTRGEDYVVVHNGDVVDGEHHGSVTQITHNIKDQIGIAVEVLSPIIKNPKCKGYYHVRGTEAHVGKSAQSEEGVAKALGAIPDAEGNHARWELWMQVGDGLVHFSHHVGTTSSTAYESTALYKELVEAYNEAGRWKRRPPDVVVRSHRHRAFETRVPTATGYDIAVVTPAWQLKTPFTHRLALGRSSMPQIGGLLIRHGDEDAIFTRSFVKTPTRPKTVII